MAHHHGLDDGAGGLFGGRGGARGGYRGRGEDPRDGANRRDKVLEEIINLR